MNLFYSINLDLSRVLGVINTNKLGFLAHYVRTNQSIVLRRFFKSDRLARSNARRAGDSAFLFANFFFVPLVSKKKWIKDKQLLGFVALFLDTKTF